MIPKKGWIIPRARKIVFLPQIWNGYSETSEAVKKLYGKKISAIHYFYLEGGALSVIPQKNWQTTGKHIANLLISKTDFIKKIWHLHSHKGHICQKLAWQILNNHRKMEQDEKLKALSQLQTAWINLDQINVPAWYIAGEPFESKLRDKLTTHYHVTEQEVDTLSAANKLSLPSQEQVAVYKAAIRQKRRKASKTIYTELSKQFGWIPFGYDGPTFWTKQFYKSKIAKLAQKPSNALIKKLNTLELQPKKTKLSQQNIIKKYNFDKQLKHALKVKQTLYILTDERKKFQFQIHYALNTLLTDIGHICGMTITELKYLDISEILTMFKGQTFNYFKIIARKRQATPFYTYITNGKIKKYLIGKKTLHHLKNFVEDASQAVSCTGQIGNKTATRVVTGKVRILLWPKDIQKMKKGEILVTWMTSPDFVLAMEKARAIVTDEGGITSHAAIVSRELGIPCIIGTKIATKIFKDGDVVEVDTNKGMVKKFK